jgi:hypothetical protein
MTLRLSVRAVRTADTADNRLDRRNSSGGDRLLTPFVRARIRFVRFCPRLCRRRYRALALQTDDVNQEKATQCRYSSQVPD